MDVDGHFEVEHLNIAFVLPFTSAAFTTLGGEGFEVAVFRCRDALLTESEMIPATPVDHPSWSEGKIFKRFSSFCQVIPLSQKRLLWTVLGAC